MEPVKLIERAASGAAHAVRHPIASAAYAAGVLRGVAEVARHASRRGHDEVGDSEPAGLRAVPTQRAVPEPQRVGKPMPPPFLSDEVVEQMVVIEPEPEHESFATEPKAVSRESEHGGGTATDAEIDAWIDEAVHRDDVDGETPVDTTGAEPLLDAGTAKALRKESETLRKAAEREPE